MTPAEEQRERAEALADRLADVAPLTVFDVLEALDELALALVPDVTVYALNLRETP